MTKIGINGFGRIGRLVFRAIAEQGLLGKTVDVVAVNDLVPADNLAYLLKYDSTQGKYKGTVTSEKSSPDVPEDDVLVVDGHKIKCLAVKEGPKALPWGKLGVDFVIECDRAFHRGGEGEGASRGGGEARDHLGTGQGRGHHGGDGREPREARPGQAQDHFQRELHDELPGAGGPMCC